MTVDPLCSTDKLRLLLVSASGHEPNLLLVSMYLLIPERQPTVNTQIALNWVWIGQRIQFDFNSSAFHRPISSKLNPEEDHYFFGQQKNRSNRSEEIKKSALEDAL